MKRLTKDQEWVEIPISVLTKMCKPGRFDDYSFFATYGFRLKEDKFLHLVIGRGKAAFKDSTIGIKDLKDADAFHMFQGLLAIAKMPLASAKVSLKMLLPTVTKNTKVHFNPFIGHQHGSTFTQAQAQLLKAAENALKAKRLAAQFGGSI